MDEKVKENEKDQEENCQKEELILKVQNQKFDKQHQKALKNAFMNYPQENELYYILEMIDDCEFEFFELNQLNKSSIKVVHYVHPSVFRPFNPP